MPPRLRLLVFFAIGMMAADLLHWVLWLARYIVPIFLVLWLGWLLIGHVAVT